MGFPPLGNFPKRPQCSPSLRTAAGYSFEMSGDGPEERFDHAGQLQDELEKCSNQRLHGTRMPKSAAVPETKTIDIGDLVGMLRYKATD